MRSWENTPTFPFAGCRHWIVRGKAGSHRDQTGGGGGQEAEDARCPASLQKYFKTALDCGMNSAALHKCSRHSRLASSLSLVPPSSRLTPRSWTALTTSRTTPSATRFYSASSPSHSRIAPRRPTRPSAAAIPFSLGFPRLCSYEARRAKAARAADMSDRDILPDHFKPVHYDLVLKDLDFSNWTYTGTVTSVPLLCSPHPLANTSQHPRKGCQAHQGHCSQHSRDQAPPRQGLRQQPLMGVDHLCRGQAVPAQHHHLSRCAARLLRG